MRVGNGSASSRGLTRRELIKRSAAVGTVAWTAPVIIGSLSSPAAAFSSGAAYPCSYVTIACFVDGVFRAVKIDADQTDQNCTLTSATSNDETFGPGGDGPAQVCNGFTWSNNCSGTLLCQDGDDMTPFAGPTCDAILSVNGNTITAAPGVTIYFAVAHDGSYDTDPGPGGSRFRFNCPAPLAGNSITTDPCSAS